MVHDPYYMYVCMYMYIQLITFLHECKKFRGRNLHMWVNWTTRCMVIRNKKMSDILFYISFYQARCVYYAWLLFYCLRLIPPLSVLILRRLLLPSISCILSDVLLFSNVALDTHDRNIAPFDIIYRGARGATVFWVCRKWNSKEWWGWFVLLVCLIFEDI